MPDASDLNDDISESAVKPQSATVDGNSVSQVSISDKIKAADRAAANEAASSDRPGLGLRFQQIRPRYE
jgi:hypothetical protein